MKTETQSAPARALHIISALANGIDPLTGEVFPRNHPLQHGEIVRALFAASAALQNGGHATPPPAAPRNTPPKAGEPWSQAEDQQLAAAFDAGEKEAALAKKHQRSRGAIRARLVRLGKIAPT